MGCYPNSYANNYTAGSTVNNCEEQSCGWGGNGFSCIINLIIILVVLQFLTTLLCDTGCAGVC